MLNVCIKDTSIRLLIFSSHSCQKLIAGTHSYIDGTKDWKTMKKRLRFQMPHVPLKVLRGQQDEEDIQDQYYERFQAPGTTTEDDNNDKDDDDDSLRSGLSKEDGTTDMGEDSYESMDRYLGWHTDSVNGANPFGNDSNAWGENTPNSLRNILEYNTVESVNNEGTHVQVVTGVHGLTNTDVASNDETAPLLNNEH